MDLLAPIYPSFIDLVQTGGIIISFFLVRKAVLCEVRVRQIGNSIKLTEHHRALWERLLADPQLGRILDPNANTAAEPITPAEEMFVIFLIIHMSDTFYAMETGFWPRPEGIAKDVQQILSLPIPRAIWERVKELQESEFVDFVEGCLRSADTRSESAA